jgi:rubrerythrin
MPEYEQDFPDEVENPLKADNSAAERRFICDLCGSIMEERQCKIICPNCGNRFDCSDLNIYYDELKPQTE